MNGRAELLVRLLDERYGLELCESVAREDISNRIDRVAELMGVSRRAAKFHLTDDVICEMADQIGREVGRRQAKPARRPRRHLGVVE